MSGSQPSVPGRGTGAASTAPLGNPGCDGQMAGARSVLYLETAPFTFAFVCHGGNPDQFIEMIVGKEETFRDHFMRLPRFRVRPDERGDNWKVVPRDGIPVG